MMVLLFFRYEIASLNPIGRNQNPVILNETIFTKRHSNLDAVRIGYDVAGKGPASERMQNADLIGARGTYIGNVESAVVNSFARRARHVRRPVAEKFVLCLAT